MKRVIPVAIGVMLFAQAALGQGQFQLSEQTVAGWHMTSPVATAYRMASPLPGAPVGARNLPASFAEGAFFCSVDAGKEKLLFFLNPAQIPSLYADTNRDKDFSGERQFKGMVVTGRPGFPSPTAALFGPISLRPSTAQPGPAATIMVEVYDNENVLVYPASFLSANAQFGAKRYTVALVDANLDGRYDGFLRTGVGRPDLFAIDLNGDSAFDTKNLLAGELMPFSRILRVGEEYYLVDVALDNSTVAFVKTEPQLGTLKGPRGVELLLAGENGCYHLDGSKLEWRLPIGEYAMLAVVAPGGSQPAGLTADGADALGPKGITIGPERPVELKPGTASKTPVDVKTRRNLEMAALVGPQPAVSAQAPVGEAPSVEIAPRVVLPSLEQTLRDLVAKVSGGAGQAGMVAQVQGNKVYVTLGSSQGVMVGDEFEIVRSVTEITDPATGETLGDERDVAGRLKVTSVQEKLSVCELLSGAAEQKNERGELNQVLPAAKKRGKKVAIGRVNVDPAAGVSQDDIRKALAKACADGALAQIVPATVAEYELRVDAKPADGKALITVSLTHLQSDTKVASAECYYKTALSLKDLGFRTAAVVDLKANLLLDPIYENAKLQMKVKFAGNVLFFPSVGADQHTAIVYGDGKVVVATKTPLTVIKVIDQLGSTVDFLCGLLRSAQATLPGDLAAASWRERSRIFADDGRIFRQIQFWNAGGFDAILSVPKYDVREVRVAASCGPTRTYYNAYWHLTMDGADVINVREEFKQQVDVTSRFRYGEHTLWFDEGQKQWYFLAIQVLSAPTDLWPTIRDKSNNNLGALSPVCGSMDELTVPSAILEDMSGQTGGSPGGQSSSAVIPGAQPSVVSTSASERSRERAILRREALSRERSRPAAAGPAAPREPTSTPQAPAPAAPAAGPGALNEASPARR